jgi:hypothetical protein
MKLKSFGCSFIAGSDLSDDGSSQIIGPTASKLTWPALVAKELGIEYSCWARGGVGNLIILNEMLYHTHNYNGELFVIGWTWIDRFDYFGNELDQKTKHWKTIRPTSNDKTASVYLRNMHSQLRDILASLICMQSAIAVLQRKNIPFIMTCIDDLVFKPHQNLSQGVCELQQYVQSFISTFEGTDFLSWSRQNQYPISDSWHPLEEAHQAAAKIMLPLAQGLVYTK